MKDAKMMWVVRGLGVLIALSLISARSYAQLTLSETHAAVQSLAAAQLDLRNRTNTWLFTVSITNGFARDTTVKLNAVLNITLADGRAFPGAIIFRTLPFIIRATSTRTFTNIDIGFDTQIPLESFNFKSEAENAIRDLSLATGQVPPGTYAMNLWLTDVSNPSNPPPNAPTIIVYNIASFSRLELLSPQDGAVLPNALPFFEWLFTSSGATSATLKVAKRSPGESPEEALSRTPLQLQTDLQNQSSYQTPTGTRPWDPGEYVWTIIGHRSGGDDMQGQIWRFTIESPSTNVATSANVFNDLTLLLGDILGSQDWSPTGKYYLNGQLISQPELQRLVNELLRNRDRILTSTVE